MGYIIWKDIDSRSITGLIIQSLPSITRPEIRTNIISIDGRDGDIVEELGYSSYEKEIVIGLTNKADINEVSNYFTGAGTLTTSDETDKYYNCRIISSIDLERLIKFRQATVKFYTQPYKYKKNESKTTASSTAITNKKLTVKNNGLIASKPLIHIKGSGSIDFIVNGSTAFTYNFTSTNTEVYIDCEEQEAYLNGNLCNRNMNGNFPMLNVGSNTITWTGTITALDVTARSRWL